MQTAVWFKQKRSTQHISMEVNRVELKEKNKLNMGNTLLYFWLQDILGVMLV
jgi:hypothetical protein